MESSGGKYSDEAVGPLKPGFSFYRWLGSGPPLQLPIPDMIIVDESAPLRHIYTNDKGFVTQHTPTFANQLERDEFMKKYIDTFVAHSTPLTTPAEPVYNRTVAVTKRPHFDPRSGDMAHTSQKSEVLTPLSLQALLQQAMDNSLEPCVIQRYVKCRATHANFYRTVYKVTSMDSGTVTGYSIGNTEEYRTLDLIATFAASDAQHSDSVDHERKSRIKFGADTKGSDEHNTPNKPTATEQSTKSKHQEQQETLYRRKATRIIAAYVKAAMKHEQDSKFDSVSASVASSKARQTWSTSTPPKKRPASARLSNSPPVAESGLSLSPPTDNAASNLTAARLQQLSRSPLSRQSSGTFLTAQGDESGPRTASPSNRRRTMARLLRSDTALTFNSERASDQASHQQQLHKYLDVFREKSADELSRWSCVLSLTQY